MQALHLSQINTTYTLTEPRNEPLEEQRPATDPTEVQEAPHTAENQQITMQEAGQVLREAEQFLGCSKEGQQFPAVSVPPPAAPAPSDPHQEEETNITVEISMEGMYMHFIQ